MNKALNQLQAADLRAAVQSMINRTCIVSFGIIKEIPAEGIVTVTLSVARDKKEVKVITCVLMNLASGTFTFNMVPQIGDKVLVVFPDRFDSEMFDTETVEPIINEAASGYNLFSGLAILCNQYRLNQHKNYIQSIEGKLDMKLAYSEEDEKNLFSLTVDELSNVDLDSNGTLTANLVYNKDDEKYLNTVAVDETGAIKITGNTTLDLQLAFDGDESLFSLNVNEKGEVTLLSNEITISTTEAGAVSLVTNNTSINIGDDDTIEITNGKATVTVDSSGNIVLDAQGKFDIKNAATSLKDVVAGLAEELKNLTTTGSPATQATSPASKATIAVWENTKLGQFFN